MLERKVDAFMDGRVRSGMSKSAAVSFLPWNWWRDAEKDPNAGYGANWGDFWGPLGSNLRLRNTASRAGQILSHGGTDLVSGVADLVGAHETADSVRGWQNQMDATYDSMMDPEMRAAYQEDEFGRAAGELGSWAVGAALTAGLGSKIRIGGALGNVLSKAPRAFKATRGVGWLLTHMSPLQAKILLATTGAAASARGRSPDSDSPRYSGDANKVMRLKDALNILRMKGGASFGSERDMSRLAETIVNHLSTYNPKGDSQSVRPMTIGGERIYGSDGRGKLTDEPLFVNSENEQRLYEELLPVFRKYHESKATSGFDSSWLGKILGMQQAKFSKVPGLLRNDDGSYTLVPRPEVMLYKGQYTWPRQSIYEAIGSRLDKKHGTTDSGVYTGIGGAVGFIPRYVSYRVAPVLSVLHDLKEGLKHGRGGDVGAAAGYAAGALIPNIARWKLGPLLALYGGAYAGGKIHPGLAPILSDNALRLVSEVESRSVGGATPGFFAGTRAKK